MLKVEIKNFAIADAVEFLFDMKITNGRQSRHRTRLVQVLNKHLDSVEEEKRELLKQHCHLDESGEPRKTEEGNLDFKDYDKLAEEHLELMEEKFIIDDSNSQAALLSVRQALDEYEGDLSGRKAVVYEHLCEVFKVDEEIEEDLEG